MENAIKAAIKLLAEKIDKNTDPEKALKFSQAALNLAHTESVIENTKQVKIDS